MLRVHIYAPDGTPIVDGEPVSRRINGVSWSSMWPKGYGPLGAQIKRDILARNPVYAGCKVVVRHNGRSVYEGRLTSPQQQLSGSDTNAAINAHGWYTLLVERQLRKRWIDAAATSFLETPTERLLYPEQSRALITINGCDAKVIPVPYSDDIQVEWDDYVWLKYVTPIGTIRRVVFDWAGRTGEGITIHVYNDAFDARETYVPIHSVTPISGNEDVTFSDRPTSEFSFRVAASADSGLDADDWVSMINSKVYVNYHADHSAYALPLYTTNQLIEDVYLYLRESDLSADVDGLAFTGVTMTNFATLSDGYETGDSLVQRLLRYGGTNEGDDSATFGLCVWGSDESSDGLPKAYITPRATDDYEYIVDLTDRNVRSFSPEESETALYNYIVVSYEDESGRTRYITPDDYSALKDDTSIAQYGKRMPPATLNAGSCTAAAALRMGRRALAFHKNLLDRMSLSVGGTIKTKAGLTVPACYVRAGERVRVKGYQGGKTYFIRNAGYNAEAQTLTMSSDLPPLMLEMLVNKPAVE